MKKILPLFYFLTAAISFAQAPTGYYTSANGLSGYELKTALSAIISQGHLSQSYGDLWDAYYTSDIDTYYENDGTILDIYSENPNNTDPYNFSAGTNQCGNYNSEGDCYNREHLFPKSWFDDQYPMYTDIHHIYPTDGKVNGQRSNFPFGEVSNPDWTSQNGSKRGNNNYNFTGAYTGTVFEPIDEFKGDIARVYFYMATRYENNIGSWENNTTQSTIVLNGTSDQVYEDWFLNMLLEWNAADPVSQKEIDRNNEAYEFQGNRNPFIDHPEYVSEIWGSIEMDTEAPSTPTNFTAENAAGLQIVLNWDVATDNIAVTAYDIYVNGEFFISTASNTYTMTSLTEDTTYCFVIVAKDDAGNESDETSEVCETTPEGSVGPSAPDLFISEYIEGSSNNKAIEVANFTGGTVDLSNYNLKLSSNGNSNWTYNYTFPENAVIANGDVFVIANGGVSGCADAVDNINSSVTAFNGNDAIGLFNNDILIDILGTLGDASEFAENITLVRNSNINTPNTVYTESEWTTYAQNTCFLGSHTVDVMSAANFTAELVSIYPNPVKNGMLYISNPSEIEIINATIYTIDGKKVQRFSNITNSLSLDTLNTGIYFIKITTRSGDFTKKIVIE